MTDIQTIPTKYKGIEFRSRLEARWAVFWNTLAIKYFYEYEEFQLSSGQYLPDFWLPEIEDYYAPDLEDDWREVQGVWIELKGRELTSTELTLAEELSEHTQRMVYFMTPKVLEKPSYSFEGTQGSFMNYWAERESEDLYNLRIRTERSAKTSKTYLECWKPGEIRITGEPEFRGPWDLYSPRLEEAYKRAQTYNFC